jgi:uncharacterized membrane protein YedE/YeeE
MFERALPNGWEHYLTGGLLIGAGVALLFVAVGLVGGMSSFFPAVLSWFVDAPAFRRAALLESRGWRLAYAFGLVAGAALFVRLGGAPTHTQVAPWRLLLGGFLVGYGARLGGGCTSGHGICGLASLQRPSLAAVVTFLATGMATAQLLARFGVAP